MSADSLTLSELLKTARHTLDLSFRYSEADVLDNKEVKRWIRWDWSIGVAFYGLWKVYELTKDETYILKMKQWIDQKIAAHEPRTVCVNTNALLTTVLNLNQCYSEPKYQDLFSKFDEHLFHQALRVPCCALVHTTLDNDSAIVVFQGEVWADTLFMSIIYLVQRGLVLQDERYIREAIIQLSLHLNCLFDPANGLFYHGWDDIGKRPLGVKWGRGNAWVTVSTIEIVSAIPFGFPEKQLLLARLDQQLTALEKLQDATGLWHTVLDNPQTYLETSVTAGIAYGVLKGIRTGLVDEKYGKMAARALTALINQIDREGNVTGGSSGTPIKADALEYNNIPQAITPFTQGLALMALSEKMLSDGGRS